MDEQVLFVDDEPNVLDAFRRGLRRRFPLETAVGGEEGLKLIEEKGPFAVVVSDMKMPGMDGARFLARVREANPETVRMILSGQADLESTISAINQSSIYRFLTKPCSTEDLGAAVDSALQQYRLITAERDILERTLSGAVKVLTEVLGLVNPGAFARASRVQQYVEVIATELELPDRWQYRLAAMLSQIGCVTLPDDTLTKLDAGQELSEDEQRMYASHPELAGKLLESIPRLEIVAQMIAGQSALLEQSTFPEDPRTWSPEALGGHVLRTCVCFDRLLTQGTKRRDALEKVRSEAHPDIARALATARLAGGQMQVATVKISQLRPSMIADEDILTPKGMRLVARGDEVTRAMLERLKNFAQGVGVVEPFRVLIPG